MAKTTPKILQFYNPTDKEKGARTRVYDRYRAMKDNPERLRMEREWDAGEKAWDALRQERLDDDWQSNYFIPLTTSVIESILAEFIDQRLRPFILPRGNEDEARARIMSYIFDYTCDVGDWDSELFDLFKGTLIRGTGVAQEYYLKDRRMVKDIVGMGKASSGKEQEREVFEYDDLKMENVSLWDIFVDEYARDFNRGPYKARDCIRRYIMDIDVFKQYFSGPIWNPLNNAHLVRPGQSTEYYQYYKPPQGIDHSKQVEVLWYWSRKPDDSLIIVANDVVIRMGPNIFKHKQLPFAKAVDVTRLDQFYGKGEPKLLESIQEELNTLRRMTIDRHHLDLDKSFLVSQSTQLDDTDLIARPHAMIPVDDPNNVKALEYGDIPGSVRETQKAIGEDSIRVTGVDDRAQSLQKAPATATEAAILKESTQKRIRMKIIHLSRGFLTDVSRQRVANIMQFYPQPRLEKIVGEKGTQEYRLAVSEAAASGLLEVKGNEAFRRSFRQIPVENKDISFDERGGIIERDKNGYGFFEAKPEFFMPVCRGGYMVKFEATTTLQISKPLLQSKTVELFDRLLPLTQVTSYDPEKLGDMLVRVNDFNPEDLKKKQAADDAAVSDNRMQLAIQLASQENQEVVRGGQIPMNGTPYAPPAHTEIHIAFLNSPVAKRLPEEAFKRMVQHAMGEIAVQQQRQGAGENQLSSRGDAVGASPAQSGVTPTNAMGNMMPDRIQGGGQVQTGMEQGPA